MINCEIDTTKLIDKLDKLSHIALEDALTKACLLVEAEAKVRCPVDTGILRASITHEIDKKDGYVGTNVEYGIWQECGTGIYAKDGNGRLTPWAYVDEKGIGHFTHGNKPLPFLLPSLDNNKLRILSLFKESIKQEALR